MKKLVQNLLAWKAKKILARHKPTIVAVSGSVGKTSTRNAIAAVLGGRFRVRTNYENYNNEFGVPLTIIGAKSPGRSLLGWLNVFWKADLLILFGDKQYPNMLVLEYGADHPGDISALCDIARPDVSVLTAISPVHVEYFGTLEKLMDEKGTLVQCVNPAGACVVNADDARVLELKARCVAPVVVYGFGETAQVRGSDYRLETRKDFSFEPGEEFAELHFDIHVNGQRLPAVLPDLIGVTQANAALAAVAIGVHFGLGLDEIAARFKHILSQPGRMRPIPGIKGALILDDSYNAAPASMAAALDVLFQFTPAENARRIAALGHMAELGALSVDEHRKIGTRAAASRLDLLVTVGEMAQDIRRGALDAGFPEDRAIHFMNALDAGRHLDSLVKKGDIVLVKGSQSARMEHIVKDLMAEPLLAETLLVRQSAKWLET